MADTGLTTQQVLAQAGRAGWQIVSVQPELQRNPVSASDWQAANGSAPYQDQVPTGKYQIQVKPPSGQGGAAEEITVSAGPIPGMPQGLSPKSFTSVAQDIVSGATPDMAIWGRDITAPSTAPSAAAAGLPTAVSAPASDQYLLTRNPDGTLASVANPNYKPPVGTRPVTATTAAGVYERQPDGNYSLVIPADKAPTVVGGTSTSDKYIVLRDSTGTTTQIANPNYVPPKAALVAGGTSTDKFIIQQNADGTTTQVPNPNYVPPKPTAIGTQSTDRFIVQQNPDGTTTQTPNPNYIPPKPVLAAGGTTTDQYIVTMNDDGTFTNTPNPNYQPAKPSVLTADTVAPFIVTMNPDGTLNSQPNPNQLTVGNALNALANQVGIQLDKGMSMQDGKDLLTSAYQVYTAQTARQQAANAGATAGASILNQRSTAAENINSTLMGAITGNKNYGLGGGNVDVSGLPAAAQAWATQMGGGQDVMQTAMNLVHQANPALAGTPAGAGLTGLWSQILEKGKELGVPPPTIPNQSASPTVPQGASANQPTTYPGGYQGAPNPNILNSATGSFQAPVTQISPDGTVTIQHTGPSPFVQSGRSEGSSPMAFQAPVMTVAA